MLIVNGGGDSCWRIWVRGSDKEPHSGDVHFKRSINYPNENVEEALDV